MIEASRWYNDNMEIVDQSQLPDKVAILRMETLEDVEDAIRTLKIRGAPAIGVAAAMGIALAAKKIQSHRPGDFRKQIGKVCNQMRLTRPTAVNLFWAIDRMKAVLDQVHSYGIDETRARLEKEAFHIYEEDMEVNRKIGENGKSLIRDGSGVLTHCNAGGLATAGYGTALGVIQAAWAEGRRFRVWVDETRPLLQGARLTAWELVQQRIPATILTDNMAGWLMKKGEISLVLVGADRIARNGDTANKIGTYGLAILSMWHHLPFYVAAPTSTIDTTLAHGKDIPIEERASDEVTHFCGKEITPKGVKVFNPAFDVTPHLLIHGIITEKGIIRKPFHKNLKKIIVTPNSKLRAPNFKEA